MKKIIIFILSFSFLIISNSSSDNQFLVNLLEFQDEKILFSSNYISVL